jgi:MscS family membrane protein
MIENILLAAHKQSMHPSNRKSSARRLALWTIAALLYALSAVAFAQESTERQNPAADGPLIPADEFNRGTPFRSGEGFLTAADLGAYETAAEYLDLRNLRGAARDLTGAQLARRFDVIINRADWADIDELVDDPAGRSNDNLPDYRDSIGVVVNEGKEIRLLMQKVPRGDGVSIWKVSNATVSLIPELYEAYGYPEFVEDLRHRLPQANFLGLELFKWVIVLLVGVLVYGAVFLIALTIRWLLRDPDMPSHRQIFRFLMLPFGTWAVLMSVNSVATWLGRGVTAEAIQRMSPFPVLITVWAMFAGMNLLRDIYSTRLDDRGRTGAMVLLHPAANAIKLLIAIAAVLIYLDQLGINITTVLAGLGVGGIAVALALQKPMEDVFGAITLFTQQPVRVGDFCRIGDATGTVEEIGLRTTRVRTLANTVIAIPNSQLASEPIDNISAREKIWYRPILRLRYDATPEQLRQILEGIRDLLGSHARVLQDNPRVRFKEIADDALLVEVYAYLATTDWAEYLELAEELNIRILEIVAQAGTSLSLPARTLHVEQSVNS